MPENDQFRPKNRVSNPFELQRVIKKRFLRNLLVFPALPGQLFNTAFAAVQPDKFEHPTDDHVVTINDTGDDLVKVPLRGHGGLLFTVKRYRINA